MKRLLLIILLFTFHLSPFTSHLVKAQEFIGCRTDSGWTETPMLRTTFHVDAGDLTETAFRSCYYGLVVTSLGYHEVYVNGTKVGDYVMQPAVSQLDKRALWVEYDITPYLHEGNNELLLWIGQGWGRIYGTPAAVQATVRKSVSDGECGLIYEILKTDSTWDASASPYSYTGNWQPMQFGGERYDARVKECWRLAAVYDAKDISVTRQEFEGNRIADTLETVVQTPMPDGSLLIDFGRVVTGWFQADFPAFPAGTEITMEYLDHIDAKPPFTETDIYISNGDSGHFTNRFHMHAFRYVRIRHTPSPLRGTPPNLGGEPDAAASSPSKLEGVAEGRGRVSARALQISAVDPKGGATFECSDPRLNAIHDMVKYTLSCLTFNGYMVDCPHIERMGYGGDGNSSTMALQTFWYVLNTYRDWLTAWGDAMDSTGDLPYVAPAFRTGGGPYWSGFIIKAPWRTYLNYGDRILIDEHYNEMVRWLDFVERHCEDGILKPWPDTERRAWFLGDWAVPEGVDKGGESVLHVNNCFLAECLADMVQMARMTGHHADAERFAAWRERLVKEIHRHFYHPESHTYANGTVLDQCYALLTLTKKTEVNRIRIDSGDSVREILDSVRARLIEDIHGKYHDHIAVGLMGVPIFTEWCIRERQADLMATILRQPDYPGYLYMINSEFRNSNFENLCDSNSKFKIQNSKLTIWESWDCGRPGKEDRSRVHNCYNGIGIWFYQAVAGIRPDPEQPGYKHFFIDPQPVEGVDWVRATKPTPYGPIHVEITGKTLTVSVPHGTTATLFPKTPNERTVESGEWKLDIK